MSVITTHVLDTVSGKPADGIYVFLERHAGELWSRVGDGVTDGDGRCRDLAESLERGTYRLIFRSGDYMRRRGRPSLYPEIVIVFECDGAAHYHLPLLLSNNSFTTYRGS